MTIKYVLMDENAPHYDAVLTKPMSLPAIRREADQWDGDIVIVCSECRWELEDCLDDPIAHRMHHTSRRRFGRR